MVKFTKDSNFFVREVGQESFVC